MKKIVKRISAEKTSHEKIKTKPITIYQLLELYNHTLHLTETIDSWEAKIWNVTNTLGSIKGSGSTQLKAIADLISKVKGKTIDGWFFPANISLGYKGWIQRRKKENDENL